MTGQGWILRRAFDSILAGAKEGPIAPGGLGAEGGGKEDAALVARTQTQRRVRSTSGACVAPALALGAGLP